MCHNDVKKSVIKSKGSSLTQKVCYDVKNIYDVQKTRHDVKMFIIRPKVRRDVKNRTGRQKNVMTSKTHHDFK